MIQLSDVSKAFGARALFDHVTWQIGDGDRVGLCGPNGTGKTTLLRMLAGLEEADSGRIVTPAGTTIGYLPQDGLIHRGRTVFDEAATAFQPLLDVKAEMHDIEHRLGDASVPAAEHDAMLERYSALQDRFRIEDGYSIELRVATVLGGLGFRLEDHDRPADTFSGGWQMRIALAKLLLGRPNLLLLDEPTNHLDLEARNWLEEYLSAYPYAVILVSHDRYFLDAVVTRITDLNLRRLTDYVGNYSKYIEQHAAMLAQLRQAKQDQDEEVARIRLFIDRFRYKATKAAQVQSRIKALEKIVPIEVPPERKRIHFSFPACPKSGRRVLELAGARKAYGDNVVFRDLNLLVERGDRLALVGPNGAGKSTLMRMLSGTEAPDAGDRSEGHQVVTEYFAQDEATRLDPTRTVYETLEGGSPLHTAGAPTAPAQWGGVVPAIRNILGGFLFSGDDVHKKVRVLSGGERTRLAVARMLLRPSNTLLLDEPTNHLDLDSKDVLLDALEDYGGTLILVSHDRYFVERLATRIVEVGHGEAVVYPGTYPEFLWHKANQQGEGGRGKGEGERDRGKGNGGRGKLVSSARDTAPAKADQKAQAAKPVPAAARGAEAHEARKQAAASERRGQRARDARRKRVADLEGRIAKREAEIKALEAAMAAPGFYDDREAGRPVVERHQALMWEVGDLMGQWEALQEHEAEDQPSRS